MKIWRYFLVLGMLSAVGPVPAMSADMPAAQLVILVDTSGSMQEEVLIDRKTDTVGQGKKSEKKAEVVKRLLLGFCEKEDFFAHPMGIFLIRHLPGDRMNYELFVPVNRHKAADVRKRIENDFETDFPVWNRRSPIADALKQVRKDCIDKSGGRTVCVLISDGKETFYGLENDARKSVSDEFKDSHATFGPLSEVRRLSEATPSRVTVHTIYMEERETSYETDKLEAFFLKNEEEVNRPVDGEILLKRMARAGNGKSFSGIGLLEDPRLMDLF